MEDDKLRDFQKRVLRKISGPTRINMRLEKAT
jgi:hypothetical protein